MITTETIKEYRKTAKKLGIWDKDYSSIKEDIPTTIIDAEHRDYALDILGGFIDQIVLMARMVVYGESESPLSNEDLDAMFAPLEPFESLVHTPYVLSRGAEQSVDDILPIVFKVANDSETYREFEKTLRLAMVIPSKVTKLGLSYGLAIGLCLRKYDGMNIYIAPLLARLKDLLANTKKAKEIENEIEKHYPKDSFSKQSFMFAALFATASTECNVLGDVSYKDMYELIKEIDDISLINPEMNHFIHDERSFPFLMHCLSLYHEDDDK